MREKTRYARSPIEIIKRVQTLTVTSSRVYMTAICTILANKGIRVIELSWIASDTSCSVEERPRRRTMDTFMENRVKYLRKWTRKTLFRCLIEILRQETWYALRSSIKRSSWRAFTLMSGLVEYHNSWTVDTLIHWRVKVSVVSRTRSTGSPIKYGFIRWTMFAKMQIWIVVLIFRTKSANLFAKVEVFWQKARNTASRCQVGLTLRTNTGPNTWIKHFDSSTTLTSSRSCVEERSRIAADTLRSSNLVRSRTITLA